MAINLHAVQTALNEQIPPRKCQVIIKDSQTTLKNFKLQVIKQMNASEIKPTCIILFTNSNLQDANQGHHFIGAQKDGPPKFGDHKTSLQIC